MIPLPRKHTPHSSGDKTKDAACCSYPPTGCPRGHEFPLLQWQEGETGALGVAVPAQLLRQPRFTVLAAERREVGRTPVAAAAALVAELKAGSLGTKWLKEKKGLAGF